jgi:hypothetical protein
VGGIVSYQYQSSQAQQSLPSPSIVKYFHMFASISTHAVAMAAFEREGENSDIMLIRALKEKGWDCDCLHLGFGKSRSSWPQKQE